MNAIARYPSHLISNSHSSPSNAFSTDSASIGRIFKGKARFTGAVEASAVEETLLTTDDAEETGDTEPFFFAFPLWSSVSPVFKAFFFSTRATASASHAAFSFPRPAGRLFHSADPASPATCSRVLPL